MVIESERISYAQSLHHNKTRAVSEAPPFIGKTDEEGTSGLKILRFHLNKIARSPVQHILDPVNCTTPVSASYEQRQQFVDDVVGRVEATAISRDEGGRSRMIPVRSYAESEPCAGIDKYHDANQMP